MLETSLIGHVSVLRGTAADCKHLIIYAEWRKNDGENKAFPRSPSLIHLIVQHFSKGLKRMANFAATFEVGVCQQGVASGDEERLVSQSNS